MAVAVATLSEPIRPTWGTKAITSQAARLAGDRPRSSCPITRHVAGAGPREYSGTASSVSSSPTTRYPSDRAAAAASAAVEHRVQSTYRSEPRAVLAVLASVGP